MQFYSFTIYLKLHHRKWRKKFTLHTAYQQKKHAHVIFGMQFDRR